MCNQKAKRRDILKERKDETVIVTNKKKNNLSRKELIIKLKAIMQEIGVSSHLIGHGYFIEAVIMVYQNSEDIKNYKKALYPRIAKKYNTTPLRVEKDISGALCYALDIGDIQAQQKYFMYSPKKGRISSKKAIIALVDYLEKEQFVV